MKEKNHYKLSKGAIVHIDGFPVEVTHDTIVETSTKLQDVIDIQDLHTKKIFLIINDKIKNMNNDI